MQVSGTLKYTAGHRLIKITKIITQLMMLRLLDDVMSVSKLVHLVVTMAGSRPEICTKVKVIM
jgi:hypothetical protein